MNHMGVSHPESRAIRRTLSTVLQGAGLHTAGAPSPLAELFGAIAHTPQLPGALCVNPDARALFDASTAVGRSTARDEALRICQRCPALMPCRAWVSGLPPDARPAGVVAGVYVGVRRKPRQPGSALKMGR